MRGDPQVVYAEDVAREIRAWTVKWLKVRTEDEANKRQVMGPVQWLANESGLNARYITRVTSGEVQMISEERAFRLLRAIDKEYLLVNGTIHVVPNPYWSFSSWISYMREQGCI